MHVTLPFPPRSLNVQLRIILLTKLVCSLWNISHHLPWRKHDWLALEEWLQPHFDVVVERAIVLLFQSWLDYLRLFMLTLLVFMVRRVARN